MRLLLNLLRTPFRSRNMDFHPGREHKSAWFLKLNPLGQLPVIDDEGLILRDAQAILVYVASRYDPTGCWYPRQDPAAAGRIGQWLGFADGLTATAGAARLHDTMFAEVDIAKARAGAHALLRILDEHLWFAEQAGEQWLCSAGQAMGDGTGLYVYWLQSTYCYTKNGYYVEKIHVIRFV